MDSKGGSTMKQDQSKHTPGPSQAEHCANARAHDLSYVPAEMAHEALQQRDEAIKLLRIIVAFTRPVTSLEKSDVKRARALLARVDEGGK
jgi:hypothetical protein